MAVGEAMCINGTFYTAWLLGIWLALDWHHQQVKRRYDCIIPVIASIMILIFILIMIMRLLRQGGVGDEEQALGGATIRAGKGGWIHGLIVVMPSSPSSSPYRQHPCQHPRDHPRQHICWKEKIRCRCGILARARAPFFCHLFLIHLHLSQSHTLVPQCYVAWCYICVTPIVTYVSHPVWHLYITQCDILPSVFNTLVLNIPCFPIFSHIATDL